MSNGETCVRSRDQPSDGSGSSVRLSQGIWPLPESGCLRRWIVVIRFTFGRQEPTELVLVHVGVLGVAAGTWYCQTFKLRPPPFHHLRQTDRDRHATVIFSHLSHARTSPPAGDFVTFLRPPYRLRLPFLRRRWCERRRPVLRAAASRRGRLNWPSVHKTS